MKSLNDPVRAAVCLLIAGPILSAQAVPHGLKPGTSSRADVEKAYGRPVQSVSATLVEYRSGKAGEHVFAQYLTNPNVMDGLQLMYDSPVDHDQVLRDIGLPSRAPASAPDDLGSLQEFYPSAFIVLVYSSANASGGVSRVEYLSKEEFQAIAPAAPLSPAPSHPPAPPAPRSPVTETPDKPAPAVPPPSRLPVPNPALDSQSLAALQGTYNFSADPNAPFRSARVELVGGRLQWISTAGRGTLTPSTNAAVTTNGSLEVRQFVMGAASIQFVLQAGHVVRVLYSSFSGDRPVLLEGIRSR